VLPDWVRAYTEHFDIIIGYVSINILPMASIKNELASRIQESTSLDRSTANDIAAGAIEHVLPGPPDLSSMEDRIFIHGDKATSAKLPNVIVNWNKLDSAFGTAIGIASANGLAYILALLLLLAQVAKASIKELSKVDAIVILALWRHKSITSGITKKKLLEEVNKKLKDENMRIFKIGDLEIILDRLKKLETVKIENGYVRLIEKVTASQF